jgi:hypothetical protein
VDTQEVLQIYQNIQNIKAIQMIQKHQTACCALCQLTASNEDSYDELYQALMQIQGEATGTWTPEDRSGGERCVFVITAPGEDLLEHNLRKLGFDVAWSFNRRNGYPKGLLIMWELNF